MGKISLKCTSTKGYICLVLCILLGLGISSYVQAFNGQANDDIHHYLASNKVLARNFSIMGEDDIIESHPSDDKTIEGYSASFAIGISQDYAEQDLSYKWKVSTDNGSNWTEIENETDKELTLTNVSVNDDGNMYHCVVTVSEGGFQEETSSAAKLTVLAKPTINQQPADTTVPIGGNAEFTVKVDAVEDTDLTIEYQWEENISESWTEMEGQTSATLTIPNVIHSNDGQQYQCQVVAKIGGTDYPIGSSDSVILYVVDDLELTQDISDQTVSLGEAVNFAVAAKTVNDGQKNISYQWQEKKLNGDWQNIDNEDNDSYSISALALSDHKSLFRCELVNTRNDVESTKITSKEATLTVQVEPEITTQPVNKIVSIGSDTSFELGVKSIDGITMAYQWQELKESTWQNIENATSAKLELTNIQLEDNGQQYKCLVKAMYGDEELGEKTSAVVTLTVVQDPEITSNLPSELILFNDEKLDLAIEASVTDGGQLNYQWYEKVKSGDWAEIENANAASYSIESVKTTDHETEFKCLVTNTLDGIESNAITSNILALEVYELPTITTQPQNKTVAIGAHASFSIATKSTDPIVVELQWEMSTSLDGDGQPIWQEVAGDNYLYLNNIQYDFDGSKYRCLVSVKLEEELLTTIESAVATLTVVQDPQIDTQPSDLTVLEDSKATFTVAASVQDSGTLSYQWQEKIGEGNWSDISGADGASYTIQTVSTGDNNKQYCCQVTNKLGDVYSNPVQSNPVTLTVIAKPIISQDPIDTNACVGDTVVFSIEVEADERLEISYQWRADTGSNYSDLDGETSNELSVLVENSDYNGHHYLCRVYVKLDDEDFGFIESEQATLTVVAQEPQITTDLASELILFNDERLDLTIVASVTDGGQLGYQWHKKVKDGDWDAITGANEASYSIENVKAADHETEFKCLVTNTLNGVASVPVPSNILTLEVYGLPTITTQPQSKTVAIGADTNISIGIKTTHPIGVELQWEMSNSLDDDDQPVWEEITGGNNLSLNDIQYTLDGSKYRCLVKVKKSGTSTILKEFYSETAILTVIADPEIIVDLDEQKTVTLGQKVVLEIEAVITEAGTGELNYKWQQSNDGENWTSVAESTNASYTIDSIALADHNSIYKVEVVNKVNGVSSNEEISKEMTLKIELVPQINQQPADKTVAIGSEAEFELTVTPVDGITMAYQWQKFFGFDAGNEEIWEDISGEASNKLVLTAVEYLLNNSSYRCLVKAFIEDSEECLGEAISDNAKLKVVQDPEVASDPSNLRLALGEEASFQVVAKALGGGAGTLEYSWQEYKDNEWKEISGANTDTFSISSVTLDDHNRQFCCQLINRLDGVASNKVFSEGATLSIEVLPEISSEPDDCTVPIDGQASFTVEVNEVNGVTMAYQWQYLEGTDNWQDIAEANSNTLTISAAQYVDNAREYQCVIKALLDNDLLGETTSAKALLTVIADPEITEDLAELISVPLGTRAEFKIELNGNVPGDNFCQWQKYDAGQEKWLAIQGADSASYIIDEVTVEDDDSQYRCLVYNILNGVSSREVYSKVARLKVLTLPEIKTQPQDTIAPIGGQASFNLEVFEIEGFTLAYQWQELNDETWTDIAGETSNELLLENVLYELNGKKYCCLVEVSFGNDEPKTITSDIVQLTVLADPVIETNLPSLTTIELGEELTLSLVVKELDNPEEELSYQWEKLVGEGWLEIDGETSISYTIDQVQASDHKSKFRLKIVNNLEGVQSKPVLSAEASLRVKAVPIITEEPTDTTVAISSTATFSVEVAPLEGIEMVYQWQIFEDGNWNNILTGRESELVLEEVTATLDESQYRCLVGAQIDGDEIGRSTSEEGILFVVADPEIIEQPQSVKTLLGKEVTFELILKDLEEGQGTLSYQWQEPLEEDWSDIQGATSSSYTIAEVREEDHNSFLRCMVMNTRNDVPSNKVFSDEVSLELLTIPEIIREPSDLTLASGGEASFRLEVTSSQDFTLAYQWQKYLADDWADIEGATSEEVTLSDVDSSLEGTQYRCLVTVSYEDEVIETLTSKIARLMIVVDPELTSNPSDIKVALGAPASFSVTVKELEAGAGVLSYQWLKLVDGEWSDIENATGSSYTIAAVTLEDHQSQYCCQVLNTRNEVPSNLITSEIASLEVELELEVNILRPLAGSSEENPLNINTGSLVIIELTGNLENVDSLTMKLNDEDELELSPANKVYYLLGTNLEAGENTITITLLDVLGEEKTASVSFYWETYRRGFGFGRLGFED